MEGVLNSDIKMPLTGHISYVGGVNRIWTCVLS